MVLSSEDLQAMIPQASVGAGRLGVTNLLGRRSQRSITPTGAAKAAAHGGTGAC